MCSTMFIFISGPNSTLYFHVECAIQCLYLYLVLILTLYLHVECAVQCLCLDLVLIQHYIFMLSVQYNVYV